MTTFNSAYFPTVDRAPAVELPAQETTADAGTVTIVTLGVLLLTAIVAFLAF